MITTVTPVFVISPVISCMFSIDKYLTFLISSYCIPIKSISQAFVNKKFTNYLFCVHKMGVLYPCKQKKAYKKGRKGMKKQEVLKMHEEMLKGIHEVEFLPDRNDYPDYPKDIMKAIDKLVEKRAKEIIKEKKGEKR